MASKWWTSRKIEELKIEFEKALKKDKIKLKTKLDFWVKRVRLQQRKDYKYTIEEISILWYLFD